jgi:hypothetical protein
MTLTTPGDGVTEAEDEEQYEPNQYLGKALMRDANGYSDAIGKLTRYEAALTGGYIKTLHVLLALQDRRTKSDERVIDVKAQAPDAEEPKPKGIPRIRLSNKG